MEKRCSRCGTNKAIAEFRIVRSKPHSWCRTCERERGREYQRTAAHPATDDGEKKCSVCGIVKSRTEFTLAKANLDGRSSRCKTCNAAAKKASVAKHADRERAYQRQYQASHRAYYNRLRREWAKRNPDKLREKQRRYYARNREAILTRVREYRRNNPDKVLMWRMRDRLDNRERYLARSRRWNEANREHIAAKMKERRERLKGDASAEAARIGLWHPEAVV